MFTLSGTTIIRESLLKNWTSVSIIVNEKNANAVANAILFIIPSKRATLTGCDENMVYSPTTTKAKGNRTEMYMLKLSVQKSFVPVSWGGGIYTNKVIIDSTIHFSAPAKASFSLSPSHEKPLSNHPLGSKAGSANPSS
jgi:hypothetical protein